MRHAVKFALIVSALVLLVVPRGAEARKVHYLSCKDCHKASATISSVTNVCLDCHGGQSNYTLVDGTFVPINAQFADVDSSNAMNSAVLAGYNAASLTQSSHFWGGSSDNQPAAGAQPPGASLYSSRYAISNGKVTCTRCHNPHALDDNPKLLRTTDVDDAICFECHVPWNQSANQGLETHPIVSSYYNAATANPAKLYNSVQNTGSGDVRLVGGGVSCTSCHRTHFADSNAATVDGPLNSATLNAGDGKLLRTDGANMGTAQGKSNLCQACHVYKTHGNATEEVGCLGCHSGHSYNGGNPNYFVLRDQATTTAFGPVTGLIYNALTTAHGGAKTVAQVWAGATAGDTAGYCERCHGQLTAMPGSTRAHSEGENCRTCHEHNGATATFSFEASGGCDGCHGYPPRTNTAGGPTGYAVNGAKDYSTASGGTLFKDESQTPHKTHANGSGDYSFACNHCHANNTHDSGTFQDVFNAPTTSLANGNGNLSPAYNPTGSVGPNKGVCSNVYCHSNGGARTGDAARTYTAASIPAWQKGATTGAITTCDACHGNTAGTMLGLNSDRHQAHLALTGVSCNTCHYDTAANSTTLAAGAIGGTHVNGTADVVFDTTGFITVGATPYASGTGTCSVYCHSDGTTMVSPDWDLAASGACGTCHDTTGEFLGGAHKRHVFDADGPTLACTTCHTNAGSGADHVNGTVSLNAGYQTTCNACHGATNGGTGDDREPVWTQPASVDCSTCHVGTLAVISAKTAPDKSSAAVTGHNKASGFYSDGAGGNGNSAAAKQCTDCHDAAAAGHFDGISGDDTRLVGGFDCLSCHGVSGSATKKNIVTHQGKTCTACHDPHGNSNIFMIQTASADFSGTVAFYNTTGLDSYDEDDGAAGGAGEVNADDLCATCHTVAGGTLHNNADNSAVTHNQGTDCFSCHRTHTDASAFGVGIGTACNDCHGNPPTIVTEMPHGGNPGPHAVHALVATHDKDNPLHDATDCAVCHPGADLYDYGVGGNHQNGVTDLAAGISNTTCSAACHASDGTDGFWTDTALGGNAGNGLNCDACHYYEATPTSANNTAHADALTGNHGKHFDAGAVCADCHTVPVDTTHITVSGATDADKISGKAAALQDEATVTAAALNTGSDADPGNATCSNVACHNPSNGAYSATWNTSVSSCTLCHSSTDPATGSHTPHLNAAGTFGITIGCTSCHPDYTTPTPNYKHRDGSETFVGGITYNSVASTCSTATCHNDGTGVAVPTPAWGTASSNCTICHSDGGGNPEPASGRHGKHMGNATYVAGCTECHTSETAATHIDGIKDLDAAKVTYTPADGGCANSCHLVDPAAAGDWKDAAKLACANCHGSAKSLDRGWPPATQTAHGPHYNSTYVAANCVDCHNDNTTTHSPLDNVVTSPTLGAKVSAYTAASGTCTNTCHGGSADFRDSVPAPVCVDCHAGSYIGGGGNAPASGLHNVTPSVSGQQHNGSVPGGCAACHASVTAQATHIDGTFTGGAGQTTQMGLAAFYTQSADNTGSCVTTTCHVGNSDDWAHQWNSTANFYTTATTACAGCHGDFANGWNSGITHRTSAGTRSKHGTGTAYECKDCHNLEAAGGYTFAFGTNDWGGTSTHGDGSIQVNSNGTTYNSVSGTCEACHTNDGTHNFLDTAWPIATAAGDAISTSCGECHTGGVTPASASGAHAVHQSDSSDLTAQSGADCAACHGAAAASYTNTLGGTHGDGSVTFSVTYSKAATRGDLTGTCSNASCHYQNATPAWNTTGSTTCTSCHNDGAVAVPGAVSEAWPSKNKDGTARTDVHQQHVTNTAYVSGVNCTDCHGDNTVSHSNAFDDTAVVNAGLSYNSGTGACSNAGCHNGATADFRDNAPTLTCTDCHTGSYIGGGANAPASGLHNVTPTISGQKHDSSVPGGCAACHTSVTAQATHIDGTFTGAAGQTTQMGLAAFYTQSADNTGSCVTTTCHSGRDDWSHKWTSVAGAYTTDVTACANCHGDFASGFNAGTVHRTSAAVVSKHGTGTNYQCKDCHNIEAGSGYTFAFGTNDWGGTSTHGDGSIQVNSNGTSFNQTNGTCEACHTNDGTHNFLDTAWPIAMAAGDAITSTCGECHTGGKTPSSSSGKHDVHGASLADETTCYPCHGNNGGSGYTVYSGLHNNGSVNFAGVTYSTAVRNDVTGTCLTSGCHNKDSGTDQSGAWNATLACNDCHYYEATPNSANNTAPVAIGGSHNAHFDAAAITACTQCHPDNSADTAAPRTHITGATLTDKANPVANNASVTVTGFNDVADTCNNAACHNPSGTTYVSNAWGTPNTGCTMCHSSTDPGTGSHAAHMNAAGTFGITPACTSCHVNNSGNDAHLNGSVDFAAGMNYTAGAEDVLGTLGGCSTTTCHNDGTGAAVATPTWGTASSNCTICHAGAPVTNAHGTHVQSAAASYGSTANSSTAVAYDFGCGNCHGSTLSNHLNGAVNLAAGTNWNGTTCSTNACHQDGNGGAPAEDPNWISGFLAGDRCAKCHGNSPTAGSHSAHVVGIHYDTIYTGTSGLATAGNLNTSSHGNATTSTTINCNLCHNGTVTASYNAGNTVCAGCHSDTNTPATGNEAAVIADKSVHVNGTKDVAFANVNVKSKAQIRDDITTVPELNGNWTRTGGYKAAGSFDQANASLNTAGWAGGSCSGVSCHNGKSVTWGDTSVSCKSCHTALP